MKRVQVIAARAAVLAGLLIAGVGVSAALADPGNGPPSSPPGQGECQHGNSGQDCKPDPQPEHGKDCQDHGNLGGVNEDHCLGATDSTTTTNTTTSEETTSSSTSTTTDETTTDETTTTDQPTTTDETTTTSTTTTTAQPSTPGSTTTSITTTNAQSPETTDSGAFTPPAVVVPNGQETPADTPATKPNLHKVLSQLTTKADAEPAATPHELPFTGLRAWIGAMFGLLLVVGGLVIRRLTL